MHPTLSLSPGSLYSPAGQRKYLTASERDRFIAAALECPRPELKTFCLLLAYTGCRISEALNVTAGAVEATEAFIAVRSLKKRKKTVVIRIIPVPDSFIEILKSVHGLASLPADQRLWTWCRCRAWQLVKEVMDQAGIPSGVHATPKGLRHGFGLHAIRRDIPLNLVQRWLGHARLETTAIYLQALGAEERELASRMWH